jgi:ABC transport system ATP-binding/permease protein
MLNTNPCTHSIAAGNDLDLSTLTALEEYLTEVFDGCLVVVSHDNFFVNRVAEHLFVFEGDGVVRDFEGEKMYLLCV